MLRIYFVSLLCISSLLSIAQADTISQEAYNEAVEHYSLGIDLIYERKYKEAAPLLRHATKLNPNFSDYFFALSNAQNGLEQLDSALISINKAMALESKQSDYLLHRANVLFKQKEYKKAIADYSDALVNASEEVPVLEEHVYFNRGNCWLYLQEYAKAKADFDKAIGLGYEIANVYHNRATALIRLDQKSAACKDFNTAVELGSKISGKYVEKYCK